jgi:hypothetical protein
MLRRFTQEIGPSGFQALARRSVLAVARSEADGPELPTGLTYWLMPSCTFIRSWPLVGDHIRVRLRVYAPQSGRPFSTATSTERTESSTSRAQRRTARSVRSFDVGSVGGT